MSQLTYSAIPTFTDVLNSTLVADQPLTTDTIKAIHHNALYSIVRCEWQDMGYYTSGAQIPTPVSPVDGYVYSYAETIYIPIFGSSRSPSTFAGAPIVASPAGLIRDSNGIVTVFLTTPITTLAAGQTVTILNSTSVTGTNFNGTYTILSVISSTEFTYQQSPSLGPDTGGGVTATWPNHTSLPLGYAILDSNGNVEVVVSISGDGNTGSSVPTWNSTLYGNTTDNHVTWRNMGANGAFIAFMNGQTSFPQLSSTNASGAKGNMILFPYVLKVDSSGILTSQVYFDTSGLSNQGTVHIIAVGQRNLNSLTFAEGIPQFVEIDNKDLRGGSFLNQSKIQQMNSNAKFAAVRMEVFSGYYADGDTVLTPHSPVDGYVYDRSELMHIPILASSRQPASHTAGQSTFPVLANSDAGTGILVESPYELKVDNASGVVTCKMFFAGKAQGKSFSFWDLLTPWFLLLSGGTINGSGVTGQGTVQVVTVAQRSSVQVQR